MVRAASLTALLLLAGAARAADFEPLEITASPWVQWVLSIAAPPGTTPSRLSGVYTGPLGYPVVSFDGSVDVVSDAVVVHLSGTVTSFGTAGYALINIAVEPNIALLIPESPQSVVQVFADWVVTTSPGWVAPRASTYGPSSTTSACSVEIDGLGTVNEALGVVYDTYPGAYTPIGMATLPAGEVMRLSNCLMFLELFTSNGTADFSASATLRFRYAKPLPLGDSNADGTADLVDVVILRRQLVGAPVSP